MWKILVVDDNFANRQLLIEILRDYANCDIAVDGKEGWEAYQRSVSENSPYDVILLDIEMPELNGLQVLSMIREHEKKTGAAKKLPIIMVTAHSKPFNDAFDRGCDDYILKPVNTAQFLVKIRAKLPR